MGMVIFFFLFLYAIAAVAVIALVRRFITTNRWVIALLMTIAILLPTYDIIITNVLGAYYCSQEPNPKTLIKKKVEYPLSIYWEDNVYPGFSAEDRRLMIINYLDGKHLQKMALNGDDGKIYVYEVNASVWESLKPLEQEKGQIYFDTIKAVGNVIMCQNQKIYTKETMPEMNYTVIFDEIKLNALSRKFLYSDETEIIDNNTKETIAYNSRIMRFFHHLRPDFVGGRYYYPHPVCGSSNTQYLFLDIFYKIYRNTGFIAEDFNSRLYQKNTSGDKK